MSDCKAYRHELGEAWGGDELSRGARAHLSSCRACGEELRRRENLRTLVGGLGKVEAPADFEFRLRARMAASKDPSRRATLRGLRLVYAFAPVAVAACFLIVTTALYLRQASPKGPDGAQNTAASETARNAVTAEAPETPDAGEAVGSKGAGGQVAAASPSGPRLRAKVAPHRPRAAGRRQTEVAAGSEGRGSLSRETSLASFGSAPVITGRNVTIALKAPAEPLRMILRDERGAARVVPVRAVSFGAQEMLARDGASRPAAATEDEGVW